MSKNNELTEAQLELLNASYPVSDESTKLQLPRFGMLSKDIVETTGEGKNKEMKVIQASGTFFTESDEGAVNEETGKKVWTKKFLDGDKQDVIILYHRRQLRMFDASLEKFYSTPIFDTADQVVSLYLDKQVVMKGTQAELQAKFPTLTLKGKPSSKLKEETILFVLVDGVLHQCNLSQSSKWEFMTYKRAVNPSSVVTTLGSVEDTFGDNTFRKMTFTKKRNINGSEFDEVLINQKLVIEQVEADKRFYLPELKAGDDKELNAFDAS